MISKHNLLLGKRSARFYLSSLGAIGLTLFFSVFNFAFAGPGPEPNQGTVKLDNPLAFDSIEDLLIAILNVIIVIAVPIIVFFIIYAGFLYVTARGNAEQVKTASRALTYAVIGGVIVLGAVALAEIIGNVVEKFQ